jgi:hypothetical protein
MVAYISHIPIYHPYSILLLLMAAHLSLSLSSHSGHSMQGQWPIAMFLLDELIDNRLHLWHGK